MSAVRVSRVSMLFAAGLAGAGAAFARGPVDDALDAFALEAAARPAEYVPRAERLWIELENGPARAWIVEPDAAPARAALDPRVREARAYYVRRLVREHDDMKRDPAADPSAPEWDAVMRDHYREVRKQYGKAVKKIGKGFAEDELYGPGRPRFLASLDLLRGDTAEAVETYRAAWKAHGFEEDFLAMAELLRAQGRLDDARLEEGLAAHPASPAVHATAFSAWMERRSPAATRKALALATRASEALWPGSVDWKIRRAQALLATGGAPELKEAEAALMDALAALDADRALKPGAAEAVRLRKEIFALMAEAR